MHEKEIKEIEFSLKQLREYEMVKFGKLLGKNMSNNQTLKHQIFDVDIKFKEKLTSMENESMKLEMEIEVLREEKADTLAQIIETERYFSANNRNRTSNSSLGKKDRIARTNAKNNKTRKRPQRNRRNENIYS